jgi:hypothetical protein
VRLLKWQKEIDWRSFEKSSKSAAVSVSGMRDYHTVYDERTTTHSTPEKLYDLSKPGGRFTLVLKHERGAVRQRHDVMQIIMTTDIS